MINGISAMAIMMRQTILRRTRWLKLISPSPSTSYVERVRHGSIASPITCLSTQTVAAAPYNLWMY